MLGDDGSSRLLNAWSQIEAWPSKFKGQNYRAHVIFCDREQLPDYYSHSIHVFNLCSTSSCSNYWTPRKIEV